MIQNFVLMCLVTGTVARESIVGGHLAKVNQFPYHVAVYFYNDHPKCGGVIIGDKFILTAAHCFYNENRQYVKKTVYVLAGTNYLHRVDETVAIGVVKKIFIPSEYNATQSASADDIAVLVLKAPLAASRIEHLKKLDLPPHDKHETYSGKTANITGFGMHTIDNSADGLLRYAEADVLTYCPQGHIKHRISIKRLCAKLKPYDNSKPYGACFGDSGGPLVFHGVIIGILSIGPTNCQERETASVYTRVSYYVDFIRRAMKDNEKADDDIRAFKSLTYSQR